MTARDDLAPVTYYKSLDNSQMSFHGGSGKWTKGRWRSAKGKIVPCENGIHFCREDQIVRWFGPQIWVFEDGSPDETIDHGDKMVTRRGRVVARCERWNERTERLFAADCAEHVLHLFESRWPDDDRPRRAIEAARAFANGEIDANARAAEDAARAAAGAAARVVAWAAEDAARAAAEAATGTTARAAADAAWAAARAAAWAATGTAARAAADAAWAAARAAAWAARAVAWAATGTAARAAAGAAEREWQTARLLEYLR